VKLILESTDYADLIARSALLEARGIPTHVDAVAHVGVVPQHLYILLDAQIDDALALLADETHEVAEPVYHEDIDAMVPQFKERAKVSGNRLMNRLLIGLLGLALGGLLLSLLR
jgi:hypothetical protein